MKLFTTLAAAAFALIAMPAFAAEGQRDAKDISYSFEGPFGTFDKGQLQRGYKVYKEVCAACHSMRLVFFRNLADPAPQAVAPTRNPYFSRLVGPGYLPHQRVVLLAAGLTYETIPPSPWGRTVKAVLEVLAGGKTVVASVCNSPRADLVEQLGVRRAEVGGRAGHGVVAVACGRGTGVEVARAVEPLTNEA